MVNPTSLHAAELALQWVLDLHTADGEGFCRACDYGTVAPCPTARAITDALHGPPRRRKADPGRRTKKTNHKASVIDTLPLFDTPANEPPNERSK